MLKIKTKFISFLVLFMFVAAAAFSAKSAENFSVLDFISLGQIKAITGVAVVDHDILNTTGMMKELHSKLHVNFSPDAISTKLSKHAMIITLKKYESEDLAQTMYEKFVANFKKAERITGLGDDAYYDKYYPNNFLSGTGYHVLKGKYVLSVLYKTPDRDDAQSRSIGEKTIKKILPKLK